jgi:HPt (histidine-containing phosphotransfer) domain-containing protein
MPSHINWITMAKNKIEEYKLLHQKVARLEAQWANAAREAHRLKVNLVSAKVDLRQLAYKIDGDCERNGHVNCLCLRTDIRR